MTTGRECEREAAVAAAARHERWSDELREHAAACSGCAEAVFVTLHLAHAAAELAERPLPDPRLVWLRARLERRRRDLGRATAAVGAMQVAAAAVAAAGALVALVRLWRLWPAARGLAGALPMPTAGATDFPVAVIATSLVVLVVLALTERSPLSAGWR